MGFMSLMNWWPMLWGFIPCYGLHERIWIDMGFMSAHELVTDAMGFMSTHELIHWALPLVTACANFFLPPSTSPNTAFLVLKPFGNGLWKSPTKRSPENCTRLYNTHGGITFLHKFQLMSPGTTLGYISGSPGDCKKKLIWTLCDVRTLSSARITSRMVCYFFAKCLCFF